MAWRLPAALESASTLHVYELWVCALCPDFQGVAQFPRTVLSTRELFESAAPKKLLS